MTTLSELVAQREEIEQRIAAIKKEERNSALAQARSIIESFELTADELFGSKSGAAKKKLAPKYRDPATGKTWSGKGPTPKWLEGKNKQDFLI